MNIKDRILNRGKNMNIKNRGTNGIKTILVVLAGLLLTAAVVNAGNVSTGTIDTTTTVVAAAGEFTLPVENTKYDATVPVAYTVSGDVKFKLDGNEINLDPSPTNYTINVEGDHNLAIVRADTDETLAMVNFTVDTTAPGEVTDLAASTVTENSITWTWTNPSDSDFKNIRVQVVKTSDGNVIVPDTDIGNVETYQATGLESNTEYEITVKTEDDAES